jgi:hypothetical protein
MARSAVKRYHIDVDEILIALAKTVADMTLGCDAILRRRILDELTHEISKFEEARRSGPLERA